MRHYKSNTLSASFLVASVISTASTARANDAATLLDDRFMLSLGTFLVDQKTELTLNGSVGNAGTAINFDRDLGLGDSDRFRVDGTWRFAPRHKVRAMYFDTSESRTRALDRDLVIGDTTYPSRVEVSSAASTTIAELAYEYVLVKRENFEVAASAGVHAIKFEFSISGRGTFAGQSGQARSEAAAAESPLPVVGFRGLWEFHPNWYLDGQAQYFALSVDGYDGNISDLRIGVTRMFGKRFGVGAGWNEFIVNVGVDRERFDGALKWRYSGAQVFFTASF